MNKKLFLMFFVCVFTFVASSAMAATAYKLDRGDGDVDDHVEDDRTFFMGGNFYKEYSLPILQLVSYDQDLGDEAENYPIETDFKVSWKVSPDNDGLAILLVSSDVSGDFLILSGLLPSSTDQTDAYEEPESDGDPYKYNFSLIASITEIEGSEYQSLVGTEISFDLYEDVEIYGYNNADEEFVQYEVASETRAKNVISEDFTSLSDFKVVKSDYSVNVKGYVDTVTFSQYYIDYIDTEDATEPIDIPEWLSYDIKTRNENFGEEDDAKPITLITLKYNDDYAGIFQDGSKGVVRVPFIDGEGEAAFLLEWPVELVVPFAITGTKTMEFDLTAEGDPVVKTANFTGATPTSHKFSTTISGVTFTVNYANGEITVTAQAGSSAVSGTKNLNLTFTDARGNSDALTLTVKVTVPVKPAITTSGTKAMTLTAGGTSVKTKLTTIGVGGVTVGVVSWDIVSVPAGLHVVITDSDDKSAEFTVSADSTATAGSKTITIKTTDTTNNLSVDSNIAVTVQAQQSQNQQNQQQENQENNQTTQQPENITNSIKITNGSGGSSSSAPFSSVKPGQTAKFTISLVDANITAKIWRLLIGNVEAHRVEVSGVRTTADDWAKITNYSGTEATIEANVPSSLETATKISMSVTDTTGKLYEADLGTVQPATNNNTTNTIGSSGSGCNAGIGAFSLLIALAGLLIRKI